MSNPRFTAHVVLHFAPTASVASSCQRDSREDFRLIQIRLDVNIPLHNCLDEQEFVVDAARELADDPEIRKTLKDGQYVSVSLAGEIDFSGHTDFEGNTEYDTAIETQWHYWRVLDAEQKHALTTRDAGHVVPADANLVYLD